MDEKRFLADAELHNLPFPIRVISRQYPAGQQTIANISISARIMDEFQVRWIDRFIQVAHQHQHSLGTESLKSDLLDYQKALRASRVRLNFDYPFFMGQTTPVSGEQCLVQYNCSFSAEITAVDLTPEITFEVHIPVITTYPGSVPDKPGGLFGQSSVIAIAIRSDVDIYPEDLVDLANRHALMPVYSFLTEADQDYIIQKVHSHTKTSLLVMDEIRAELAYDRRINWFSVRCSNYGILHPYSTVIGIEKSYWVPFTQIEEEL